jgi:Cu/Ag efflux pump CusA
MSTVIRISIPCEKKENTEKAWLTELCTVSGQLMTSSVAILGLIPASLSTNIGSDVQRPLATVIVYGLAFGTIITLYALPALYYMLEKWFESKQQNNEI